MRQTRLSAAQAETTLARVWDYCAIGQPDTAKSAWQKASSILDAPGWVIRGVGNLGKQQP
jgi:hypothetical protein